MPAAVSDIYYRDEIGNISTSDTGIKKQRSLIWDHVSHLLVHGRLNIHPDTLYLVMKYLYNSGDKFILNMNLVDHIFDDMIIDEMVVKIILPERSHKLNFDHRYKAKQIASFPALI